MPAKMVIPRTEYAPTKEEVLEEERQTSQARQDYVRRSLIGLSTTLLNLLQRQLPPCSKPNKVNGADRIWFNKKPGVCLEFRPPYQGELCLQISFVVNKTVEGIWKLRLGPSYNGNPLIVEFIETIPSQDKKGKPKERVTPLSTGLRLNLNGLTDRTIFSSAIDEHIISIVMKRYNQL